jgi:hypothetical protein
MSENTTVSLYDRLGGTYSIAAVVDDFIDRIMIAPACMKPTIGFRDRGLSLVLTLGAVRLGRSPMDKN